MSLYVQYQMIFIEPEVHSCSMFLIYNLPLLWERSGCGCHVWNRDSYVFMVNMLLGV